MLLDFEIFGQILLIYLPLIVKILSDRSALHRLHMMPIQVPITTEMFILVLCTVIACTRFDTARHLKHSHK